MYIPICMSNSSTVYCLIIIWYNTQDFHAVVFNKLPNLCTSQKKLSCILSPLTGSTSSYTSRISAIFVKKIKVIIEQNKKDLLMSFDIQCLLPGSPLMKSYPDYPFDWRMTTHLRSKHIMLPSIICMPPNRTTTHALEDPKRTSMLP